MLNARSPKYPGLYDRASGVRFRSGRAEVTVEQARLLAKRPFRDGLLVEDIPAKRWAQQQEDPPDGDGSPDTTDNAPDDGARETRNS